MNKPIQIKTGVSGEARCILYDENMNPVLDTGWNSNYITELGLNLLATRGAYNTYVGTSAATGSIFDTQMASYLATANGSGSGDGVIVQPVAPDYWVSLTKSRRFGAGIGTGTINEVGMGDNAVDVNHLICRQALLSPIVKGATQSLDVIWRWTIWPDLNDYVGVYNIGGIDYNVTTRARQVDTVYNAFGPPITSFFGAWGSAGSSDFWRTYNGWIGSITEDPTGTSGSTFGTPKTVAPYVWNSKSVEITLEAGLDSCNISGGIGAISVGTGQTYYQTGFKSVVGNNNIPKTASNEMDLTWVFSWDRH